jgi:predicted kinase
MSKTNTLVMMCGVPGSGKSTLIKKIIAFQPSYVVLSTDDYIETQAALTGKTYNEIFPDAIKDAERAMEVSLQHAIKHDLPIIWDQTNISPKSRKAKLAKVPDFYQKIAIWFHVPDDDEWKRRLASRPGKTIPKHILNAMAKDFVIPTVEEGFDSILTNAGFEMYMNAIA